MKVQIRQCVFETNSSSTHSLQITRGNIEDAKHDVINSFFNIYEKPYKSTIINNSIELTGLECEYGGDEMDVFTIISNWEAKLQYIAGYVYCWFNDNGDEDELDLVNEIFTKCVKESAAKHGINIDTVTFNVKNESWPEDIYMPEGDNTELNFESLETLEQSIKYIMNDEYTITFGSVAYSSYEGHKINIIK